MEYLNEHLFPGQLGHFFLILSFIASLGASVAYFLSVRNSVTQPQASASWIRLARIFFITEVVSVVAIFVVLFYIISHHYFEYKYAWQHSSRALDTKYLLSCFWEGQEGSFLLWSFWHSVLGCIFIWKEKKWEGPVMTVVSLVQVLLATMLLGATFFGNKIGSNPFLLLRNSGVLDNAPFLHDASGALRQDYLPQITDGNGLNILLQNYWMVIHPPVLFLGFASTLIPFAFAIGGLWTKRFTEWTRAALPWALFSAGVFGLGIMMGAAWAYESLSFGGFWAWDPVENASLVPWLVLVAGLHTLLIYRHTGNALRTTYLFFILSFVLVLYSTYLTRSGELQDTSVHAFTGDGITIWHLRILLLVFTVPALFLFFKNYKKIPFIAKEEETSAREFWMFVGSLVIFLSALLITVMTSIPVINKIIALFSGQEKMINPLAVGEDSEYAYNRIQIFVAIILGLFTGFGMYLKYKATPKPSLRKLILPTIVAAILAALILIFGDVNYRAKTAGYMWAIWVGVIAAVFALVANAGFLFRGFRTRLANAGGPIAHLGFAMMLLGILISASKKEVLSYNTTGIAGFFGKDSKENPGENLTLIKGIKTDMGKYWVTYTSDSTDPSEPSKWYYHILFDRKDGKEQFTLTPNAYVNHKGNMGLSANPDARHYLTHDIFTYITSLPDPERAADTSSFKPYSKSIGDTIFYSKGFMVLEDLQTVKDIPNAGFSASDSATMATIKVVSQTTSIYTVKPILINKDGALYSQPDTLMPENLVLQLQNRNNTSVEIGVKESNDILQYITLKAYKFPFINLLWLGTLIMVAGFFISMLKRREKKMQLKVATSRRDAGPDRSFRGRRSDAGQPVRD